MEFSAGAGITKTSSDASAEPECRFRDPLFRRVGKEGHDNETHTKPAPPVRVTINGKTYRSTVAVMGGVFMVGVSAENRKIVGVAAGDKVDVTLELDTEPRVVTVPSDLKKAALAQHAGATSL